MNIKNHFIHVAAFSPDKAKIWDTFLGQSINSHFFYSRDFLKYHEGKLVDRSLMLYLNEKLIGILPACECPVDRYQISSHYGLSFAGLVLSKRFGQGFVNSCLDAICLYLKDCGYKTFHYKPSPFIYHSKPCQADLYWLWKNNAQLVRRDSGSVIFLKSPLQYSKGRKSSVKKAFKSNIRVELNNSKIDEFWNVLTSNLQQKYDALPTHDLSQIKNLTANFPDNIKLYAALLNDRVVSGALLFVNPGVVHTQYLSSSQLGKDLCALDLVIDTIVSNYSSKCSYLSFGISTFHNGKQYNSSLGSYKESFDSGPMLFEHYSLTL